MTRADMSGLYEELRRAQLAPLWENLAGMVPAEPRPRAQPHRWSFAQTRPHLLEAGRLITAAEAERRVVVLVNPGLNQGLCATDTLYAGLQLILPGEVAPPHRHSQSALRLVLEGEGAWTSVDGERVPMHPGDFIITPPWRGHGHGGGSEPVIWMDGLDVPLVGFLHAEFREDHPDALDPPAAGTRFAWPYAEARAALEALRTAGAPDPWTGYRHDYLQPDGGPALPTLGASLSLLPRGFTTQPLRSTDSAVASVIEGAVRAKIGGRFFDLGPKDVVAIPGWTSASFKALEDSVVFAFSDRPAHQALGLWREQRDEA
jgi:gentisate 1,2-dioxygenase